MARRLRSPGDREGGGSDSAGYSLTPRAERSPELTWLPGAAWVAELPKSPAARLAGDVWGSPTRKRVPGFSSAIGLASLRTREWEDTGFFPHPQRGPLAPRCSPHRPRRRSSLEAGEGWSRVDAAARQELPVVGD